MAENTPNERGKNPFLSLLDGFSWLAWKIVELPFLLAWLILRGAGEMFRGVWKAIGELEGAAWFWKPSNSCFQFLGKLFGAILFIPAAALRGTAGVMDKNAPVRRFLLLLLLAAGAAWAYWWGPQLTWGKWHPYHDAAPLRYADGMKFRKTSGGEWIWPKAVFTAAHPELPPGTRILLENPINGKKLAVRINDRRDHLYLSDAAASFLGLPPGAAVVVRVYTREKLLQEPENSPADPAQLPGEWTENLEELPFRPRTEKTEQAPPVPPAAPAVKAKKAQSAPPKAPTPARKKNTATPPGGSDDRLDLGDPVLVPDRSKRR